MTVCHSFLLFGTGLRLTGQSFGLSDDSSRLTDGCTVAVRSSDGGALLELGSGTGDTLLGVGMGRYVGVDALWLQGERESNIMLE